MRVINRTAVTLTGAKPYIDWTQANDADRDKGVLTVTRAKPYGSAFLLPEFEIEEDVQEWIEENYDWLFELQLSNWTEDELCWPDGRTLARFRQWFAIEIHSLVVDVGDDDIEGEEL